MHTSKTLFWYTSKTDWQRLSQNLKCLLISKTDIGHNQFYDPVTSISHKNSSFHIECFLFQDMDAKPGSKRDATTLQPFIDNQVVHLPSSISIHKWMRPSEVFKHVSLIYYSRWLYWQTFKVKMWYRVRSKKGVGELNLLGVTSVISNAIIWISIPGNTQARIPGGRESNIARGKLFPTQILLILSSRLRTITVNEMS